MSDSSQSKRNHARPEPRADIQSLEALKIWLVSKGIDISDWGRGEAKSVENLWEELVSGEMYLQDDPALRVVPVVRVIIRQGKNILIEAEQEFTDNRTRPRNHPPSEKIKPKETYLEAARRCVQEELGVDRQDIEVMPSTYHQIQEENDSLSYPGILSRYIFHVVEARVKGLPETDFWTTEADYNPKDPIRRHHWVWQSEGEASD